MLGYLSGQLPLLALKALISDLSAGGTTVKCCMLLSTFTPNQDTQTSYNDVKAYEHAATGNYATGGATCGTKTVTYSSRVTTVDMDDPAWSNLTVSNVRYLAFYDATPASDANKKLLALFDIEAAISTSASPVQFNIPVGGLFTFTVAPQS
jgi:hypothetical protein